MATKITIQADGKQAEREFKKVGKSVKTLGTTTEKTAKKTAKSAKNMAGGYLKIAAAVAALAVAGRGLSRFSTAAVKAAGDQEKAEASLTQALKQTGQFSEETRDMLLKEAAALQRLTGAADEATLANFTLATGMGVMADDLPRLALALENVEAAGLPAESILRGLASAITTGESTMVSRYIPAVRNLTKEQMRQGAATDMLLDQFGGLAEAQATTLPGSIRKLKAAYGDLVLEGFGGVLTKVPEVSVAINEIANLMLDKTGEMNDATSGWEAGTREAVFGIITIFKSASTAAIRLKQVWQGLQIVGQSIATGIAKVASAEQSVELIAAQKELELLSSKRTLSLEQEWRLWELQNEVVPKLEGSVSRLNVQTEEGADAVMGLVSEWQNAPAEIEAANKAWDELAANVESKSKALANAVPTNVPQLGPDAAGADGDDPDGEKEAAKIDKIKTAWEGVFGAESMAFGDGTALNQGFEDASRIRMAAFERQNEAQEEAKRAGEEARDGVLEQIDGAVRLGDAFGGVVSNIANAGSAAEGLKAGIKSVVSVAIAELARMLITSIATKAANAAAAKAEGDVITSAMTPAAVATTVATAGSNVPFAVGAMAVGSAAMTAIIGAIGDRGLERVPGAGRMTVSKLGSETILDPVGTTKYHEQMDLVTDMIRNSGGGVLAGMTGGGGQTQVTSRISIDLGGTRLLEIIDRQMANMIRSGNSEFGPGALVNP